jgi:FMN-dependent NADH-azoreductase
MADLMKTLWIEASPKGDDALRFGRDAAIAKFAPPFGESVTAAQQAIWQQVLDEIERVRRFDQLVVSSPMWNWHVPPCPQGLDRHHRATRGQFEGVK